MKKLMFMLAAVAVAACTQAASVSWTCTNVKDRDGNSISGIAYFVNAATLSQSDAKAFTKASDWTTALSGAYSYTPSAAGKYTSAAVDNATLGLGDDVDASGYLVIFDTATITDASHYYMTEVKDFHTYGGTFEQQVKWGSQSSASQAASAWADVKPSGGSGGVPEPTSGLLLLMGGAMLALRRRRA